MVVRFSVSHPIGLGTWSGRFVSRVVGEVLGGVGVRVPHGAKSKPFVVTPILDAGNRAVGRLIPGAQYWFRVSFFCSEVDCTSAVRAFMGPIRLSTGEELSKVSVNVSNHELAVDSLDVKPTVVYWRVRYWPTVFIFRSQYITWPSAARFLASTAQTLARVLRGGELVMGRGSDLLVGVIDGVDLRSFIKDLTYDTEVVGFRVRRFTVNLGKGRRMPAFTGSAQYISYTDKPSLLKALLNVANTYGVGKNRPLGLGYVTAEVINEKPIPRHKHPH